VRSRILASVAVAAAVALGATGCEFMTSADTTNIKDITDGVNVNVGKLNVRNALLIANKSGSNARFVATVVNQTSSPEQLTIQAKDSSLHQQSIEVPANSTLDLAHDKTVDEVVFRGVHVTPGDLTKVYFSYPAVSGTSVKVPVLTGAMAEYATLVPTPVPAQTLHATPGATDTATPSDTASSTPAP
jgi:hypothetical protein